MRSRHRGTKKHQGKDKGTLMQTLAALYPQKILRKPRTKTLRIVRRYLHLEDFSALETSYHGEKKGSCESHSKNNSIDSTECIADFVIPGNIPDLDSLICCNSLLAELFLDIPDL